MILSQSIRISERIRAPTPQPCLCRQIIGNYDVKGFTRPHSSQGNKKTVCH